MIKRVAIDNFRCFVNFEFVPGRLNLLLGSNGSGKSSFFDVLTGVVDLIIQSADVNDLFPTSTLTRWDTRELQRIEVDVETSGSEFHYELVVRHDRERDRSVIDSEIVKEGEKTLFSYADGQVHLHRNDGRPGASFPFRGNRSFLSQIEERPETVNLMWFLDFMESVLTLRLDARSMQNSSKDEEDALARDGSNFASWYRHVSQETPEKLQGLWGALKQVIPGFQSMKLVSSGGKGRSRDLVLSMAVDGQAYDLDFDELSDGQRALVALYGLLYGSDAKRACLLLDEPEVHVGLTEVQPWLVELDDKFGESGQVFVVSHHPEVVDYLAAAQPFVFERPSGGPARVREAIFDRESGLTASKQLARGLSNA